MSTVRTQKRIDPAHLASILGVPVSTAGGAIESTAAKDITADVDRATLQAAVDAYAYDPDWADPDQKRLRALAAKANWSPSEVTEALRLVVNRLLG